VPESVFDKIPSPNPYISNGTVSKTNVTGGNGPLVGNSSYVYHTFQHEPEKVPGGGGLFYKIDSTNFPIATTIAATFVVLEPKGLRELHWHPTVRRTQFEVLRHRLIARRPRSGCTSMKVKVGRLSSSATGTRALLTSRPEILPFFPITVVRCR
jgi:hypothetical protein